MNELLPKFNSSATREGNVELAWSMAIALDGVITPAQAKVDEITKQTQRESVQAMMYVEREHHFKGEQGENTIFPNLEKLFPVSPNITVEEYETFSIEVRAKLIDEANINRTTLMNIIELAGGTSIDDLRVESAQTLLRSYSDDYNYMVHIAMNSPTYQGSRRDRPFTESQEFRNMHFEYTTAQQAESE